ncbi:hypothetical protein PM3016_6651 [Paenibacillus mucilaginosus 3016]|uniref:Uncharacterized protein n=1 Tax=Paenibacillus mucilaginosus 3016 TaxID=1116391 RepID=H6NMA4_9BACL|nr:hypothetical protein PM3016_6651 [Paenibacillus mucilaginosus 3016]
MRVAPIFTPIACSHASRLALRFFSLGPFLRGFAVNEAILLAERLHRRLPFTSGRPSRTPAASCEESMPRFHPAFSFSFSFPFSFSFSFPFASLLPPTPCSSPHSHSTILLALSCRSSIPHSHSSHIPRFSFHFVPCFLTPSLLPVFSNRAHTRIPTMPPHSSSHPTHFPLHPEPCFTAPSPQSQSPPFSHSHFVLVPRMATPS